MKNSKSAGQNLIDDLEGISTITTKLGDRSEEEEKIILELLPKDREPTDEELIMAAYLGSPEIKGAEAYELQNILDFLKRESQFPEFADYKPLSSDENFQSIVIKLKAKAQKALKRRQGGNQTAYRTPNKSVDGTIDFSQESAVGEMAIKRISLAQEAVNEAMTVLDVAMIQHATRQSIYSNKALNQIKDLSITMFGQDSRVEAWLQNYQKMSRFEDIKLGAGLLFGAGGYAGITKVGLMEREMNPDSPMPSMLIFFGVMAYLMNTLYMLALIVPRLMGGNPHSRRYNKRKFQQKEVPAAVRQFVQLTDQIKQLELQLKDLDPEKQAEIIMEAAPLAEKARRLAEENQQLFGQKWSAYENSLADSNTDADQDQSQTTSQKQIRVETFPAEADSEPVSPSPTAADNSTEEDADINGDDDEFEAKKQVRQIPTESK